MLSGIWLLAVLAIFSSAPHFLKTVLVAFTLVLWLSHRFATTFNAFCNPAYRPLLVEQRLRFVIAPILIFLFVFAFIFAPMSIISLDIWSKAQLLATLFFLYNTYHFGVQHYGVISIYRIRSGQNLGAGFKKYEKFYCLVVGSAFVALAQIGHGAEVVQDSMLYRFWSQASFDSLFHALKIIAPITIGVLTVFFYIFEFKSEKVSFPKVLYVASLAIQGVLAYFLEPLAFLILWGVQHWMVSVALAAHMAQNDKSDTQSLSHWYRFWGAVGRRFWPTVVILAGVSILLTPLLQYSIHPDKIKEGPEFLSSLEPLFAIQWAVSLFIAFNFASVYVHFVMDRAIFRFSNPSARKISIPLLFAKNTK